jgi:hypothetical protein
MLEALEPQTAKQLVDRVVQDAEKDQAAANATVSAKEETEPVNETETTVEQTDAEEQAASVNEEVQDPAPASDQTQTVTVDDITKIIVRKVKQDRTNNEKIGSILKTYGVARVSELPTAKYDEVILEVPKGTITVEDVCSIMNQNPVWANGLVLSSAGYRGDYYFKD